MKRFRFAVFFVIFFFSPASFGVDALAVFVDSGDTEGLIKAIEEANAGTGPGLIFVRPTQGGETDFVFTEPYNDTDSALPPITANIEIFPVDSLQARITFRRDPNADSFRLAHVQGDDAALGFGVFNIEDFNVNGNGGAILAEGKSTVTIQGASFRNNFASGSGGAISVSGESRLFIRGTGRLSSRGPAEFTGNRAGSTGGAIDISGQATGSIAHSVFSDNNASVFGCDLNLSSGSNTMFGNTLILQDNTFTATCPNVLIENPLGRIIARNNSFAGSGDAFDSTDLVRLFSNLFDIGPPAEQAMIQSTGKNPKTLATCNDFGTGAFDSLGYNIESGNACFLDQPTDIVDTDPMTTQNNGAIELLPGSPAIDAGASEMTDTVDEKFGLPCGYVDSRGLGRPQDGNQDGTFECDIGTYEVQGGDDIDNAQSSAWFDPTRVGEGAFVEMIGSDTVWLAEFTYAPDGSGPAWWVGVGTQVGNSIVVDEVLQPEGGVFGQGFDANAVVERPIGSMSMVFSSCESGADDPGKQLFESYPDSEYGDLLVDAMRLSNIIDCQGTQSPQAGRSGSFYDPARSGEGIFVQWLTNGNVVIIWYTYDLEGNQLWILSDDHVVDGDTVTAQLLYPAGVTTFGKNFDPAAVDLQPWGEVTLKYQPGCDSLTFSYDSQLDGFGSGTYDYIRLTGIDGAVCDL